MVRAGVIASPNASNKAYEHPLDRGIKKNRNMCQSPRHVGEILLLIVLLAHVDMFE